MAEIACNVSNCKYYGEGNVCQADEINVSNNTHSGNSDMEIGSFSDAVVSERSRNTQCVTFEPVEK